MAKSSRSRSTRRETHGAGSASTKTSYQRRIERGLARGLTRSQARGHARPGEASVRSTPSRSGIDEKLEFALKSLRKTGSQSRAAKGAGISTERFRRFLSEGDLAHREGRAWTFTDDRPRNVRVISGGRSQHFWVRGFDAASLVERHNAAITHLIEKNDPSKLAPFIGATIRDAKGRRYVLETRPNVLYRLAAAGGEGFEHIYRLTT